MKKTKALMTMILLLLLLLLPAMKPFHPLSLYALNNCVCLTPSSVRYDKGLTFSVPKDDYDDEFALGSAPL